MYISKKVLGTMRDCRLRNVGRSGLDAGRLIASAWLLVVGAWLSPAWSETFPGDSDSNVDFIIERIADGLGVPWGMAFINTVDIIFTERNGRVGLLNTRTGSVTRVIGAPRVMVSGQGGLLDVAVPPKYRAGDWIYFTYSKEQQGRGVTVLARAHLADTRLVDWQDILVTQSASDTGRHFGSRIAFDGHGHLFFTVGDRGHRPNGQDLKTHAGSVLRVKLDGSVPPGNPFIGRRDVLPEIWSYGHRNPQGIVYDSRRQRLWVIEHGPRGGDELNLVYPGRNYGWPVISYGQEYWGPVAVGEGTERAGMEQPAKVYIPSIAPGSLLLYSGRAFPAWRGDLFAGALALRHLNRIILDEMGEPVREERLLESLDERIRALTESPEGWLYLSTDSGKILRLRPG